MKWFACVVACLALLCVSGFCDPAHAQHCENGVCHFGPPGVALGPPVVAMPGPYFGGPVYFAPATMAPAAIGPAQYIVSEGHCPGPVVAFPCSPRPGCCAVHSQRCRPAGNDWRFHQNGQRSGSIGISLNWNRSGSGRVHNHWH